MSEATGEYREEIDTLAAFVEDRCVVGHKVSVPATPLYHVYQEWCEENGEHPETQRSFGMALKDRGFEQFKYKSGPHKDRSGWRGIGIRAEDTPLPKTAVGGDRGRIRDFILRSAED